MRLIALAAAALAAGVLVALLARPPQTTPTADASSMAVESHPLVDLSGASRRLEEWQGKLLLVNFWATWCAPCREEMPYLQQARERYLERNFEVIGIAIDEREPVIEYRDALQIQYPLLLAMGDVFSLMAAWGNEKGVLPHTVIIGRSGTVLDAHSGPLLPDQLAALIEPHL